MLWDYRSEGWTFLLTSLLNRALCCAYLTASVNEYIDISLGACGRFPQQHQVRVLENLMSVVKVSVTVLNLSSYSVDYHKSNIL